MSIGSDPQPIGMPAPTGASVQNLALLAAGATLLVAYTNASFSGVCRMSGTA